MSSLAFIETVDSDTVASLFSSYRTVLDAHHEARYKVIKASQTVTAASKKIIFALQRVKYADAAAANGVVVLPENVAKDIALLENNIRDAFATVRGDLAGAGAWKYQRQISGGVQEYIEALLFHGYLSERRIFSHEEVVSAIGSHVLVTYSDYILGLFDTSGELMRYAITNLRSGTAADASDIAREIGDILRILRTGFSSISSPDFGREYSKKLSVLCSSSDKVEQALYSLVVRGSELRDGWISADDPI